MIISNSVKDSDLEYEKVMHNLQDRKFEMLYKSLSNDYNTILNDYRSIEAMNDRLTATLDDTQKRFAVMFNLVKDEVENFEERLAKAIEEMNDEC